MLAPQQSLEWHSSSCHTAPLLSVSPLTPPKGMVSAAASSSV